MAYRLIVGGKIIETTGGNTNIYAGKNIVTNANKSITISSDVGHFYGEPEDAPLFMHREFDIDFELDKDQKTVVPLGILDFENNIENPFFSFKYILRNEDVDTLNFKITDENNEIIYQLGYLKPVIIQAKKKPLVLFEAKKPTEGPLISKTWDYLKILKPFILEEPDFTKVGEYHLNWDGFDNNEIYDSTRFSGKKLKAEIIATKGGKIKSKTVEFETQYSQVNWTDVKIDRKAKRIDVTLRVNLTDGGTEGLSCQTFTISNEDSYETFTPTNTKDPYAGIQITTCDWDKIPASEINPNNPVIKTRTKSFEELRQLSLDGLKYHWSRNKNHFASKNVNINSEPYEVYLNPINIKDNAIGNVSLIYNTNGDWMRSGNPGSIKDPMTAIGNLVSRQAICYNVGYIKYSNSWGYSYDNSESEEFKFTTAHEIGHEILKKYGGTFYSYGHKGSVNSVTQNMKSDALAYPKSGEIDIMPYYPVSPPLSQYKRYEAAEQDVLSLIWLTKIKIK